jgi:microcystin-dependent protein
MATPYLAEIRLMSFGFPPKGWALCDGQLLPINQNQALFSILGTTYGGDGRTNFALPDLRGRLPMHVGNGHTLGERAGEAAHTLTLGELPAHSHQPQATSAAGTATSPSGAQWAATVGAHYGPSSQAAMANGTVLPSGGNQAHENRPPFLTLSFVIALQGIFPSQN